jgi:hypothetical protein
MRLWRGPILPAPKRQKQGQQQEQTARHQAQSLASDSPFMVLRIHRKFTFREAFYVFIDLSLNLS